jgi:hypothetical protein
MGLKRESARRAKGEGYYSTYGATADDVLDYISGDIGDRLAEDQHSAYGTTYKVTIIVEEI